MQRPLERNINHVVEAGQAVKHTRESTGLTINLASSVERGFSKHRVFVADTYTGAESQGKQSDALDAAKRDEVTKRTKKVVRFRTVT